MTCPHCGGKKRSNPQHNRFFKLIDVAYHHWPEKIEFQPDSSEHLRAWLLCKAGYKNVQRIEMQRGKALSDDALHVLRLTLKAAGSYAWIVPSNTDYFVISPQSMRFDKLPHKRACTVMALIDEMLCDIFEIRTTEELLKEHERAA